MIEVVYCVFQSSWDGPDLQNIFKSEEKANKHAENLNTSNKTNDFYVEEWLVN